MGRKKEERPNCQIENALQTLDQRFERLRGGPVRQPRFRLDDLHFFARREFDGHRRVGCRAVKDVHLFLDLLDARAVSISLL